MDNKDGRGIPQALLDYRLIYAVLNNAPWARFDCARNYRGLDVYYFENFANKLGPPMCPIHQTEHQGRSRFLVFIDTEDGNLLQSASPIADQRSAHNTVASCEHEPGVVYSIYV